MEYIFNASKSRSKFTVAMKDATQKAFHSTENFLKRDEPVKISMEICKNGNLLLKCQVVTLDNKRIHAEISSDADYYASIYELKNKIQRQVHDHKKKKETSARPVAAVVEVSAPEPISKTKQIVMESVTPEQAIADAEGLGHTWYVFKNSEENDAVCVVYKRFEGDYGLVVCK